MKGILLVDDDEIIRYTLQAFLEYKGYWPISVENGTKALDILKTATFNLVLLDIGMPGMDGLEVLKNIKASQKDLSVIMLTGESDMDVARTAFMHGANDYLTKPFKLTQLEACLIRHGLTPESQQSPGAYPYHV